MTELRMYFEGERVGAKFARVIAAKDAASRGAFRRAAADAAGMILDKGRADISSAPGNWGQRWPNGLRAEVTEGGGRIKISVSHKISYFSVFQFGATIYPKNPSGYLWIPLPWADDAKGVSPRDYPAPMFFVDRAGKSPLLFAFIPGVKGSAVPKYSGHDSVTIPKKFHTVEIARDVAKKLPSLYRSELKSNG